MDQPDFLSLKTCDLDQTAIYKLLIGGIIPRPIALVSTMGSDQSLNLAPFSFFNAVASKPASVILSISYKNDDSLKDTYRNISETRELVINSADENIIDKIVKSASEYPYGVSEFSQVGLTPLASEIVKPPRVLESSFQMECVLDQVIKLGDDTEGSFLIIAKILMFHLNPNIYKNGRIDFAEYHPAARLGGFSYARLTDLYEIPIPKL